MGIAKRALGAELYRASTGEVIGTVRAGVQGYPCTIPVAGRRSGQMACPGQTSGERRQRKMSFSVLRCSPAALARGPDGPVCGCSAVLIAKPDPGGPLTGRPGACERLEKSSYC